MGCSSNRQSINDIYVKRVIDGDTFVGDDDIRYRFFGIDAPELSDTLRGTIAKNVLNNWINKQMIKIKYITTDVYKRKVVKAFYHHLDIGLELIKCGYAFVDYISLQKGNPFYTNDFVYYQLLLNTQYKAYKAKNGFWANYN